MNLAENCRCTLFAYFVSLLGYQRAMQLQDVISRASLRHDQSVHLSHIMRGSFINTLEEIMRGRKLVEPLSCLVRWNPFHPLNQVTVEKLRKDEKKKLNEEIRSLRGEERASRSTVVKTFLYKRDKFNAEDCTTRVV